MSHSYICHTDHEDNHIIKDVKGSHAYKEIESVNILTAYTFGCPRAMMIIVINTNITLPAVICFSMLNSHTFFTIPQLMDIYYLLFFKPFSVISFSAAGN